MCSVSPPASACLCVCRQAQRRQERLEVAEQKREAEDAKLLRCGYCDGLGHNRRTCPVLKARPRCPVPRLLHQTPDPSSTCVRGASLHGTIAFLCGS